MSGAGARGVPGAKSGAQSVVKQPGRNLKSSSAKIGSMSSSCADSVYVE
jgi:hypothetical protein